MYFIVRNIIFYGKLSLLTISLGSIPVEIVISIFVLLFFQELSGKIHDAYIQGLKHQSKLVSTTYAYLSSSGKFHVQEHPQPLAQRCADHRSEDEEYYICKQGDDGTGHASRCAAASDDRL